MHKITHTHTHTHTHKHTHTHTHTHRISVVNNINIHYLERATYAISQVKQSHKVSQISSLEVVNLSKKTKKKKTATLLSE